MNSGTATCHIVLHPVSRDSAQPYLNELVENFGRAEQRLGAELIASTAEIRGYFSDNSMMGGAGELLSHVTTEADLEDINRELRENGVKVNTDEPGLRILKHIGLEMVMSKNVARGRFVVNERSCQPFGVLHGGMTGFIAESMATRTGQYASGQEVQGLELNANHLRAVPLGEEVLVIAKPVIKGGRIQVWEVKFEKLVKKKAGGSSERVLTAICRVTLVVGSAVEPVDWKTTTANSKL